MSYYRPIGKELYALKKIRSKVHDIEDAQSNLELLVSSVMDADRFSWNITTDFALDGVRSNGVSKTTTIADIILAVDDIRGQRKRLDKGIKREMDRLDKIFSRIERILAPFGLCPSCLGKCGRYIKVHGNLKQWEDCCFCEGRGVLL